MNGPVLECRGLTFGYGPKVVLDACSLAVAPGEFVSMAGPNGAGKSTLLSLIAGAHAPKTGSVLILGKPRRDWSERELARQLAVVAQAPLVPAAMSALEVVLLGRSPWLEGFLKFEGAEDRAIASDALERVGMAGFAQRAFGTLSGGEKRLVTIARALAQQPRILLLDEPAASLDLAHQQQIFRLLQSLNRSGGLTILTVTHDLNLAALYSDRLLILHEGRIVADDAPAALLREESLAAIYGAELWVGTSPDGGPVVGLRP